MNTYLAAMSGNELLPLLARSHKCVHKANPRERWTYYDTFDWRFYQRNLVFKTQPRGKRFRLQVEDLWGELKHRLMADRIPTFADELPRGVMRDLLGRLLEMRALLPTLELTTRSETIRILDRRRKTVCRLSWIQSMARGPNDKKKRALAPRLQVVPVRGYVKEAQRIVRFIESELQLEPESQLALHDALEVVGAEPAVYSSKVAVTLDPLERSDSATKQILQQVFRTLQINQPGLLEDVDSEFLHDFRVSVRRTRSALAQIKGVFPARRVDHFKREFSWLGKATGPVRDLDVYLLHIPKYQAALPPAARADLIPLRNYLQLYKRREHRKLVKVLKSKRYRKLLAAWQDFLDKPPPLETRLPRAALPISEVARERIWKAYSRVIRKGGKIKRGTRSEKLHALRIDCKKLRYLMEFFRSLYPPEDLDRLIKELKRLQDNLGNFNDFVVQQATLRRWASQAGSTAQLPVETLMCIGRLLERLENGQRKERSHFLRRFRAFASPGNTRTFSRLFQPRMERLES